MLPNDYRYPFSPYPDGWFAVGWSHEVQSGQVLPLHYMGRELVLYRTAGGTAVLADAFCPHLGAHLGHTGSVEGEELRCAFHGFCFDGKGECTSTSYGTKAPPRAKMTLYPVHEFAGMILAWFHHENAAPDWTVPEVSQTGWSALSTNTTELRTHPQETTENSVDMGHLVHVHLYRDVRITQPLQFDGPNMFVSYGMSRDSFLGSWAPEVRTEFDVMVHGLGYSLVEVEVEGVGLKTRHYVMNTPIDGDKVHVRAGVSTTVIGAGPLDPMLKPIMKHVVRPALQRIITRAFIGDMSQDYPIWETKKYETRPALAKGDGPIPAFRKWARRFYGPFDGVPTAESEPAPIVEIVS